MNIQVRYNQSLLQTCPSHPVESYTCGDITPLVQIRRGGFREVKTLAGGRARIWTQLCLTLKSIFYPVGSTTLKEDPGFLEPEANTFWSLFSKYKIIKPQKVFFVFCKGLVQGKEELWSLSFVSFPIKCFSSLFLPYWEYTNCLSIVHSLNMYLLSTYYLPGLFWALNIHEWTEEPKIPACRAY